MEQKITENSFVSVGLIILLIGSLGTAIWIISAVSKETEINTTNIQQVQTSLRDFPTREEFNNLKGSIDTIQEDVKTLLGQKKN